MLKCRSPPFFAWKQADRKRMEDLKWRLNAEEKDIIERLYFHDEPVRSVAKLKSITHPALIKKRNKILEKLKKFIEEI